MQAPPVRQGGRLRALRAAAPLLVAVVAARPAAAQFYPWGDFAVDAKLTAPAGLPGDHYGYDLDLAGDRAAIGAPGRDAAGKDAGAVHLLDRDAGGPGAWGELLELRGSDTNAQDAFGYAVATGGGLLAVGAPGKEGGGAAYLFDLATGAELARVTPPDPTVTAFGRAVATDGTRVLVSALWDDPATSANDLIGRAWLYAAGLAPVELLPSAGREDFGRALALGGGRAVVGTPGYDAPGGLPTAGALYVFDAATGQQQALLLATAPVIGEGLGIDLDLDGDLVISGGHKLRAVVFDLAQQKQVLAYEGEGLFPLKSLLGHHVAIGGTTAYVSVPGTGGFGGAPDVGRVLEVDIATGTTIGWFVSSEPGSTNPAIVGNSAVAADGWTVLSGDHDNYTQVGQLGVGAAHAMHRHPIGLGASKELVAPGGKVAFMLRGGTPGLVAGIAIVTAGSQLVPPVLVDAGLFSALGEAPFVVPITPATSGLTLGILGGELGGPFTLLLSNLEEFQVL